MKPSIRCVNKLKGYEQYREFAYPDPYSPLARATRGKKWGFQTASYILAGLPPETAKLSGAPWTVGYGETKGVTPNSRMNEPEAYSKLVHEVDSYGAQVFSACTVTPNQNQLDAMTSLAYNIGVSAFRSSSVLRAHNRRDFLAASRAFGLWNKAQGQVSSGLTSRRASEAAWYLEPMPEELATEPAYENMAQQVDPESSLTSSSINRASTVAGGTAAVATVAEVTRTVADVKYSVASLGDWLLPIALVCIVGLCGYIVYTRYKQRKEGWT